MRVLMRVLLGLVVTGLLAGSLSPAHAQQWCGFLKRDHARLRCGFDSIKDCQQALGHRKIAVCIPNPSFANSRQIGTRKG